LLTVRLHISHLSFYPFFKLLTKSIKFKFGTIIYMGVYWGHQGGGGGGGGGGRAEKLQQTSGRIHVLS
ncbi:hypothetical protein ACJX0J_020547, partial [Zea mays]